MGGGTGSERLITSLGHLIRGAIDNMACFSRSGGEGGRILWAQASCALGCLVGGGRRDVSVVMALALSGADSALRWRISRLSAFIFSLMVVKILRAIN